jgi:hypothetical protein
VADRRVVVSVLACLAACSGESGPPNADAPRLLDRACALPEDCSTLGSAQRTTGITGDSVGYRIGPGWGSLTIPLQRDDIARPDFALDLLVAGSGTLDVALPSAGFDQTVDVPASYDWVTVGGTFPSSAAGADGGVDLTVSVNDGSRAEIADLRGDNLDYVHACSVSAVGRH